MSAVIPAAHFTPAFGDGTRLVPVFSHGEVVAHALVDADDYRRVQPYRWSLSGSGYARASVSPHGCVYMHRFLLGLPPLRLDAREVDHINRDRLDNRRCNLRVVTHAQNGQNQIRTDGASRHRNVHWHRPSGLWSVRINVNGKKNYFGYYRDKHEAAQVAARERARLMPFSIEGTLARQRAAVAEAA